MLSSYTIRLNRRHGLSGHVFSGRCKALLVEGGGGYLKSVQGWTEADLFEQPRKAPAKLDLAARLRRETAMPLKWIAARVHLGTSKSANAKLHQWMAQRKSVCRPQREEGRATLDR